MRRRPFVLALPCLSVALHAATPPRRMNADLVTTRTTTRSGAAALATFSTVAPTTDAAIAPVVFLHAGVADSRMWQAETRALAPTRRCVAFDRRGFGDTPPAGERYDNVADTIAVLDATKTARAILVGCSNGGRVALDTAVAHPGRVAGLVLVCAAVGGAPPSDAWQTDATMAALYARWQEAEAARDLPALVRLATHVWLDGPLEREGRVGPPVRPLFDAMVTTALATGEDDAFADFPDDAYASLATLRCPVLVVWGTLDVADVTTTMRHAAATIPDAEAFEIRGAAHLPNLERPDLFVPRLARFARRID